MHPSHQYSAQQQLRAGLFKREIAWLASVSQMSAQCTGLKWSECTLCVHLR